MNGAKTFFFMLMMTALLVLVGAIVDASMGGSGIFMAIFGVVAVVGNIVMYWKSDTVVLKMHRARVVTEAEAPKLHRIVDGLIRQAKMPKPKICIVPSDVPNAFATGRNPSHAAVAVTEGLMQTLNDEELEGVIAHELAHVQNHDMLLSTIIASMAAIIAVVASQARWFGMFFGGRRSRGGNPFALLGLIFLMFFAPMVAMFIRSLVSKQREFGADEGGARMSRNPLGLASALKTIERSVGQMHKPKLGTEATSHLYFINHFGIGRTIKKMFSTHPPTEDRIKKLLAMDKNRMRG